MNRAQFLLPLAAVLLLGGCTASANGTVGPESPSSSSSPAAVTTTTSLQLTEADVKKEVTKREERLTTGIGSAPRSVKINWESVKIGASRVPNLQDKVDGVRGDVIYPVQVKYERTQIWSEDSTEDRTISYGYDFYLNEFGEWTSMGTGNVN